MNAAAERETTRFELAKRLESAVDEAERNRLGQFATPPTLADEIILHSLAMLSQNSNIRFLEPGFGTGSFFSALLRNVDVSRVEAAHGYEIDRRFYEAARELWKGTPLKLHGVDFTRAAPPMMEAAKSNLVVCNPPYVRHHHLSQTQKRAMQSALVRYVGLELNGLSGLYAYFLVLSKAWMAMDGVGGWLVPSEFMDVNYGRIVKQFLLERVTLCRIHRFDPQDAQFDEALVSSAVVFFTNTPPPREHTVEFSFGGTVTSPARSGRIRITDLRAVSKWTSLPHCTARTSGERAEVSLADLFTIKRGLATGSNAFFMLTGEEVDRFQIPTEFLRPILPSPRELETDEIETDENGDPRIKNRRHLLSCDLPEAEVRANYPTLRDYLQRGMEDGVHQRYLCRHRVPWYAQERRPPAPFLCTYMGRRTIRSESPFRFILNHSQATAANVYLMLYPKPVLDSVLRDNPELYRAVHSALSSIAAEVLMGEGRVYGGGLHKMEPNELANVPAETVTNALANRFSSARLQLGLFG